MSLFNQNNDDEEQVYLPVINVADQLPDQSLSEEVKDVLRAKGYKSRFKEASKAILPLKILAFILALSLKKVLSNGLSRTF